MAIDHQIESKNELLHVVAHGKDDNLEDAMNYGMAVIQAAKENSSKKILCDERNLVYNISVIDTYQLAETASRYASKIQQIAIVSNPKNSKDGKFYETVASNRGLRIKMFLDYNEAIEWLK